MIEQFKLVAKAYKTSWQRLTGVKMLFGKTELNIGPTLNAPVLNAPSMHKLDLMGHNPYAVYAIVLDFRKSKLATKGLEFLVDDIEIRLGPQKNPLVIRPEVTVRRPD